MATAIEGMSSQLHAPAILSPRKDPVPIVQEAGWAPGPVWMGGKSRPTGIPSPDRPARNSVALPTELRGPIYMYIYSNDKSHFSSPLMYSDMSLSLHDSLIQNDICCII